MSRSVNSPSTHHGSRGTLRLLGLALLLAHTTLPQTLPYTLSVPVNEVSLTFHAADFHGIPIDDLKLSDLRILDNGKQPQQVLSFEAHQNLPVRFGILMDTSRSMLEYLTRNQWIAGEYLTRLLRKQSDTAFLIRFDSQSKVLQTWTSNTDALINGLRNVNSDTSSRIGGTALFDSLYKACRDQFGATQTPLTGNFILLFTDGIDNASHARLQDDIDICQRGNTAIYVFNSEPQAPFSKSQKLLHELTAQTGGVLFFEQSRQDIWHDLLIIDANLRSQYRVVYRPQKLKTDGSFHHIKLESPTRGGIITTRSGYYALP